MQKTVDEAGPRAPRWWSFCPTTAWMSNPQEVASRVTGIDAIMGGHTHDGMPVAGVITIEVADTGDQRRIEWQVPGRARLRGPRTAG